MSDSVRPHRQQPTMLPRPWDSPGKNTGVGCHFLLQCMKVESESEVAQSCLSLSDTMECGLPGSSNHGVFQARVLEWVAIAFSSWRPRCLKYKDEILVVVFPGSHLSSSPQFPTLFSNMCFLDASFQFLTASSEGVLILSYGFPFCLLILVTRKFMRK